MVTAVTIESRLAEYEPSKDHIVPVTRSSDAMPATLALSSTLREAKFPKASLLAYSQRCASEWIPNLDAGDASRLVISGPGSPEEISKREDLVRLFAGKSVLARLPSTATAEGGSESVVDKHGFAPWSLAYAGHQFGQFAGQLGDGRAISIRTSFHPLARASKA